MFDRVGRVNHTTRLGRESEERNALAPHATPGGSDRGKFQSSRALLKHVPLRLRCLGAGCRVDRLDRRRQRLAILPACVVQTVANQMHDARLPRRAGIDYLERLTPALEAIGHSNPDAVATAGLEVVEHFHPEFCTFGIFAPDPQNVFAAIGQHAARACRCAEARTNFRGHAVRQCAGRSRRSDGLTARAVTMIAGFARLG